MVKKGKKARSKREERRGGTDQNPDYGWQQNMQYAREKKYAIASPSNYQVGGSVIDSFRLELAIVSPSFVSLF